MAVDSEVRRNPRRACVAARAPAEPAPRRRKPAVAKKKSSPMEKKTTQNQKKTAKRGGKKKALTSKYFQATPELRGTMREEDELWLAEHAKVHRLLSRLLVEVSVKGPLTEDYVSAASLHRLRGVNRYFKAVAERHLRLLPDLLVFGGANHALGGGDVAPRSSAEVFNFLRMKWFNAPAPPAPRTAAACCEVHDGRVFVGGGAFRNDCGNLLCECCEEATADCFLFDPKTVTWRPLPSFPQPLVASRAVSVGASVMILGGARPPNLDDPAERVARVRVTELGALHDDEAELHGPPDDQGRVLVPVQPANAWGDIDLKFWLGTDDCHALDLTTTLDERSHHSDDDDDDDDQKMMESQQWVTTEHCLPRTLRGGGVSLLSDGRFVVAGDYWATAFSSYNALSPETFVSSVEDVATWHAGRSMEDMELSAGLRTTRRRKREELSTLRGACAATSLGGSRVLVVGGKADGSRCHDRLRLFDARRNTWTLLPAKLPRPLDGIGLARIGCSVLLVGGAEREFHPTRTDAHRDAATAAATLFDLDTHLVYTLPDMVVDRADPSVAPCTGLVLDNPAYDEWSQAHADRDARYREAGAYGATNPVFFAPGQLVGCTIS